MLDIIRKLIMLGEASHRIHAASTVEGVVAATAEEVRRITDAHMAAVTLDSGDGAPSLRSVSVSDAYEAGGRELQQSYSSSGGDYLVAPLQDRGGRPFGLIELSDRGQGAFDEADRAVLAQLAETCSLAVETKRLLQSARHAEQLLETTLDGVWMLDGSGLTTYANARLCELLGVETGALEGRPFNDFTSAQPFSEVVLASAEAESARGPGRQLEFKRKDGGHVCALVNISALTGPAGEPGGVLLALVDITERKRLEQEREQADATIRSILDGTSDAFFSLDPDWRMTHVNPAAARLLRRPAEDLLDRRLWDSYPDLERTEAAKVFRRVMQTGAAEELVWFYKPLGAWFEIRVHSHIGGLAVYFRDIGERIAHEKELAERQDLLEAALNANNRIIESSLDVICTIDATGRFVRVGPSSRRIWGYGPEELEGRHHLDLVHPEDRARTRAESTRIVRSGAPSQSFENRYLRHDGAVAHMLWSSVWSEEDQLFYAFARDITERVKLEDQLRQAHRLETIGQLTGGVAHDFNNLLTVIIGNLETLAETAGLSAEEVQDCADAGLAAAERAAILTQRMLAFARRQPLTPARAEMPAILDSLQDMLPRVLPACIELSLECAAEVWPLHIDRSQLETALLNLAINARDAMPEGGALTITARNAAAHEHPSELTDDGDYVAVTVRDTGFGMSPEIAARAFEPFFTTKEVGAGSGLGLSMVHGFATQSGGKVTLASEPNGGTVITLLLPRHAQAELLANVEAEGFLPARRERILVVEDDDAVRDYVVGTLQRLGYTAVAANDAREGLIQMQTGERFDLLFTDVVMPGDMNGAELAAQARRLQPGIKVLVTTGYAQDPSIVRQVASMGFEMLGKPYRSAKLASAVQAALEAPQAPLARRA